MLLAATGNQPAAKERSIDMKEQGCNDAHERADPRVRAREAAERQTHAAALR